MRNSFKPSAIPLYMKGGHTKMRDPVVFRSLVQLLPIFIASQQNIPYVRIKLDLCQQASFAQPHLEKLAEITDNNAMEIFWIIYVRTGPCRLKVLLGVVQEFLTHSTICRLSLPIYVVKHNFI